MATAHRCDCRPGRSGGFSLIELMLAMVIGLIGTIVIFQVFSIFEGQKRTATSAGDAQQNGLLALVSLERDARMAGYGLSYLPLLGCTVSAYDSTGARNFTFALISVQLQEGAAGAPDTLTLTYGNSGQLLLPAKIFTQPSNAGATATYLDNTYGFRANDLVVFGQVVPTGTALPPCTMRQLTAVPPTTAASNEVDHNVGARYNKAGGLPAGQNYTIWDDTSQINGRLYDLGPAPPAAGAPVVAVYSIQNSQLMYQNLISDSAAAPAADGIVQMQAQLGYDANADGVIQAAEWINGCATATQLAIGAGGACVAATPANWSQVIAIRIAVLARSAQPEVPSTGTGTPCDTTTVVPAWTGGNIDPSVPNPTSWKCYRYRIFETQVPIRNLIWFAQ